MRFSTTKVFPLALMFSLAALTLYLDRAVRDDDAHPSLRRHDPDYLLVNFTTTSFNAEGAVEGILGAQKMIHYPDDDTTELVAPRVVQSKPDSPRMTVRADRGALSRDGEEIFLYDNVVLVREADKERPEAQLTTEFLHIVRDRSLVRTDRHVQMVEGRRRLSGRGMEYDNENQRMTLYADVRGRFEPEPAPPGKKK
jgi:lipopolysaccharide export system protein LptC